MTAHGGDWTPDEIFHFLANPKKDVPGTKMTFAGLPKPEDRANVIAYPRAARRLTRAVRAADHEAFRRCTQARSIALYPPPSGPGRVRARSTALTGTAP